MIKAECQDIKSLINRLQVYNNWRRGADIKQPQPTQLGKDIDKAIELLKSTLMQMIKDDPG